jgi:hypothetical protein
MDSATRNGCAALRVHRQPVPLGPSTGFPRRRPAAGKRSAFPTTGPFEWAAARVTDHVNLGPVFGLYCTIHSTRMESLSLLKPEPAGRNPACQLFGSRPPPRLFSGRPLPENLSAVSSRTAPPAREWVRPGRGAKRRRSAVRKRPSAGGSPPDAPRARGRSPRPQAAAVPQQSGGAVLAGRAAE